MNKFKLIINNCILGFYSGLPLLLLSSTLQAWYVQQGIDLITVGALSLVSLPYLLKFLWAPLVDYLPTKSKQKRKVWIILCQLMLAAGFVLVAAFNPKYSSHLMAVIALALVFLSATLDIAIDAYKQVHTPQYIRSTVVAGANIAYRLAMLLSGGIALIFADNIGWQNTYHIMALIMVVGAAYSVFIDDSYDGNNKAKASFRQQLHNALAPMLKHKLLFKVVVLFSFYKVADAFLLNFLQPFLLQGLHYSLSEVGVVVKIFGTSAIFLGTACAGVYASKISTRRAMLLVSILQALVMLLFVICAVFPVKWFVITAVFLESFINGAAVCVLVVCIMSLCSAEYAATQLAFFSAVAAVPRVVLGPICGYLAAKLGWVDFFIVGFLLSLPIIFLLAKSNKVAAGVLSTEL